MKRKLFCIFLMLAGAAAIAGTILHTFDRPGDADVSPVVIFILLSVVTIIAAAWYINREPNRHELSKREMVFLRVFRAVNILSILVCFAFVAAMLFVTDHFTGWMRSVFLLIALAAVGIVLAALSLKEHPPIVGRDIAKAAVALVIAAALSFIHINYMPKYSQKDGLNMLRSKEEFAQADVFYPDVYGMGEPTGAYPRWADDSNLFGGNPFYDGLYQYYCDSYSYDADGLYYVKWVIDFNPATGAYEYPRTQELVKTYIPGEWPEFKWSFMYDKDGQHGVVLNLYFRKWWPHPDVLAAGNNLRLFVSESEWDAKIKDVMYPHDLPEDEALAFLQSKGEEALKTKLLEQVNLLDSYIMSKIKDKTLEVYFFGINIATYQNGEIVLKL